MDKFITKDSGQRKEFCTGMQRDADSDKPRFDLIMPFDLPYEQQMLTRWANLMKRGAQKYSARNWEKASTQEELDRFMESAFRHFIQWFTGETDEDHAVAVMFNITGAEYVKWKRRNIKYETKYFVGVDPIDLPDVHDDIAFTEFDYENLQRT